MTIARHVRVTGQVQGVFYRGWTRTQADELGVSGWVRNCADGSVEAHLEGEEHAVERMIEHMRSGPANAWVDGLHVEETEPVNSGRFEVRR